MVVAILACQVALSVETSFDMQTRSTNRKSCRARIRRRHVPRSSLFLDNILWYWRVLMGAWEKFHSAEHSVQCTLQHTERPAYHDDLPYLWQSAPLWDRAHRLVTLSNDVPPNPNRARRGCCRDPVILSHARWKRETLTLSVDVHPNPSHPKTTTLHALTLNVGGPHLSRRRWGCLVQETHASSPHIIALQEVRFRTGEAHLAYTAKAFPNHQSLAHDDKRPDMMFLVHERVHKYCKLMAHRSPHAIALRVQIQGVPEFPFVNQHGPFTLR